MLPEIRIGDGRVDGFLTLNQQFGRKFTFQPIRWWFFFFFHFANFLPKINFDRFCCCCCFFQSSKNWLVLKWVIHTFHDICDMEIYSIHGLFVFMFHHISFNWIGLILRSQVCERIEGYACILVNAIALLFWMRKYLSSHSELNTYISCKESRSQMKTTKWRMEWVSAKWIVCRLFFSTSVRFFPSQSNIALAFG